MTQLRLVVYLNIVIIISFVNSNYSYHPQLPLRVFLLLSNSIKPRKCNLLVSVILQVYVVKFMSNK